MASIAPPRALAAAGVALRGACDAGHWSPVVRAFSTVSLRIPWIAAACDASDATLAGFNLPPETASLARAVANQERAQEQAMSESGMEGEGLLLELRFTRLRNVAATVQKLVGGAQTFSPCAQDGVRRHRRDREHPLLRSAPSTIDGAAAAGCGTCATWQNRGAGTVHAVDAATLPAQDPLPSLVASRSNARKGSDPVQGACHSGGEWSEPEAANPGSLQSAAAEVVSEYSEEVATASTGHWSQSPPVGGTSAELEQPRRSVSTPATRRADADAAKPARRWHRRFVGLVTAVLRRPGQNDGAPRSAPRLRIHGPASRREASRASQARPAE